MKWIASLTVAAASLVPLSGTLAQPSGPRAQVGDTYEVALLRESSQQTSDGSSGSTHDADMLVERVMALRPDGVELEYDVAAGGPKEERARLWQFPARILRPPGGALQLLNAPELEARVERWLKAAKLSRAACGHWIFTWNAFQIDCDPHTVLETIRRFVAAPSDLREGAPYREHGARGPVPLARGQSRPDGATFVAEMEVDPEAVRRERAEADVVVGEVMRKPTTLEAALAGRAKETVSGTISVTFDTDAAGNVRRRTKLTRLSIKLPDGRLETHMITESMQRRLVSSRTGKP